MLDTDFPFFSQYLIFLSSAQPLQTSQTEAVSFALKKYKTLRFMTSQCSILNVPTFKVNSFSNGMKVIGIKVIAKAIILH